MGISTRTSMGATGRGFAQGLSAFWWVGAAALGSFLLAFVIGPRIYRVAKAHNLLTVGDYLEMRYDSKVRLFLGATLVLFEKFEPAHFLAEVSRLKLTHVFMVPAMINMLRQASIATGVALFVVIIGTPARHTLSLDDALARKPPLAR